MALGRSTGDRVEGHQRAIRDIREKREADLQQAAQYKQLAAAREARVDELAEQEAAGTLTREAVDAKLVELDREQAGHLRQAAQREAVAAKRDLDVERLEREIAQVVFEEQLGKTAKAVEEHAKTARSTPRAIAALLAAVRQASAAAAVEAEARVELERLRPGGDERRIGYEVTPDFPDGIDELIRFLQAGPPQTSPREMERARKRSAAALESTRREQWSSAIRLHASRGPVDEAALRRLGYDDEIVEAVHREHRRLVDAHAAREAAESSARV